MHTEQKPQLNRKVPASQTGLESIDWKSWDFSLLDVAKSKLVTKFKMFSLLLLTIYVLAAMSIVLYEFYRYTEITLFDALNFLFVLMVLGAIVGGPVFGFGYYLAKRKLVKSYRDRLENFAKNNGFNFQNQYQADDKPGGLFSHFKETYAAMVVSGQIYRWPFELYKTVLGINKHDDQPYSGRYKFTVLEIRLPHRFPHILLSSKVNKFITNARPLRIIEDSFEDSERLLLSSEFEKYTSVYVPTNYQIEVLSMLTPDVMDMIINFENPCDIEIIDDRLYMYFINNFDSREIKSIFRQFDLLVGKIGPWLEKGKLYDKNIKTVNHSIITGDSRLHANRRKSYKKNFLTLKWIAVTALVPFSVAVAEPITNYVSVTAPNYRFYIYGLLILLLIYTVFFSEINHAISMVKSGRLKDKYNQRRR